MKEELLLSLSNILLDEGVLVKFRVDEIYKIRTQLETYLNDDELIEVTNKIRERVQYEAEQIWRQNNCIGAILMATGVGKSKVGVSAAQKVMDYNPYGRVLIVVPTEKLRDNGWPEELEKWGIIDKKKVEISCYASINKIEGKCYSLVILDEGHNITENNSKFFEQNSVQEIMWLSATKPNDISKKKLLKDLGINPVYEITLDEAQRLGLISPFDITVVLTELDKTEKYIQAGNKVSGYFLTTELSNYQFLLRRLIASPGKAARLKRMRFIYDLKSKTRAAKWILDNIVPQELRTLIFCGSKKQAIELCDKHYFSKPSKPRIKKGDKLELTVTAAQQKKFDKDMEVYNEMIKHYQGDTSLELFVQLLINRIACVEALNEGHNFSNMDCGFIVQLNSTELDLWQRIGRNVRWRPGHRAKIIIICADNTVDKDWVEKATANLDKTNIKWINYLDLKEGKETINF